MKLATAMLCVDCEEIVDLWDHVRAAVATASVPRQCPSCCNASLYPLARWLRSMKEDDTRNTRNAQHEDAARDLIRKGVPNPSAPAGHFAITDLKVT